jgi:hypothetical protein
MHAGLGNIGWHTFRNSYASLLRRVGADIKVQQELLRALDHPEHNECLHASTQAMSDGKRRKQCHSPKPIVIRDLRWCHCGLSRYGSQ